MVGIARNRPSCLGGCNGIAASLVLDTKPIHIQNVRTSHTGLEMIIRITTKAPIIRR
jgi:hypothetical protein